MTERLQVRSVIGAAFRFRFDVIDISRKNDPPFLLMLTAERFLAEDYEP